MTASIKSFILLAICIFSINTTSAYAQSNQQSRSNSTKIIDYFISVKTANIQAAGTSNDIQIKIHGATKDTGFFPLQGSYAQGRLNEFSVSKADIGKIYAITVNVNGQFADKWKVEYVTITKNEKNRVNKYSADGYYEFYINKEMSYNPTYIKPKNLPAHYDICLLGANEDYILPNATDADVSKPKTIDQEIEDGFIEVGKGVEKAAEETGNFIKSIFDF